MDSDRQAEYARKFALRDMRTTDVIAFRHVTEMLSSWIQGKRALDVGCGAGRSTEFLVKLGAQAIGVDHNPAIIKKADGHPSQDATYHHWKNGEPMPFQEGEFDLVFSSWMLLELGSQEQIIAVLKECRRVLKDGGRAVFVVNTAEFYAGDWVSLDVDFPENQAPLQNGQAVKARLLPEDFVVSDYYWDEESYVHFFTQSNFAVQSIHKPLGLDSDGIGWKDERHTAPYAVYELVAV